MKNWIFAVQLCSGLLGVACAGANLLSDAQFSGGKGTYPDETTSPWFTAGEKGGWATLIDSERSFDNHGQSLKFNRWRGDINVLQNTGHVIQAGHDYHISLWIMTDEPSDDPAHTAKPGIFVTVASAKQPDGPFHFRKQFFWEITTSKHGVWERIEGSIDAADLEEWIGECIQLRIVKKSLNSSHAIWVDDIQLHSLSNGEEVEVSAGLLSY
ncbi:hypothetical protein PDESU_05022 [Pontiella desulfatans]|uniref:CBM-cenC domain-containing protein n=1 Tax=Pontiella desulfatans TaxID=2750659 RepID=A0A6C2UA83_PONDE|nr:hypothetical protein [Pontiella desulfatans]VGO16431.1 hypothetical protein PDESU_05022 [Pontiella desulfatans]